jgi:AAA family ATPase
MKFVEVRVRPVPSPSDKSGGGDKTLKGASRIYVNKEVLLELTGTALENGKRCFVEKTLEDGKATTREASLWAAADPKVSRGVVQMSKPFQDACDLKLGDQVKVIYTDGGAVPDAEEVVLEDVTAGQPAIEREDMMFWEWNLKHMGLDDVFPGFLVKRVPAGAIFRNFKITSVNGLTTGNARFVAASTKIRIGAVQDSLPAAPAERPAFIKLDTIAGLEHQIRELNDELRRWWQPYGSQYGGASCGLVLDGGHGTGKTMLVEKICQAGWGPVHRIRPRDKLSFISQTFQTARDNQPSIIVMDEFESIIDNDRSNRNVVIQTVKDFLGELASEAETERPNVLVLATCMDYTANMPSELREVPYFDSHINLPLPGPARRKEILSSFRIPLPDNTKDSILKAVSEKTHAYNGKDLKALAVRASKMLLAKLGSLDAAGATISPEHQFVTEEMLTEAMTSVPPSAMHDISLKPPPVHWDDIGGQQEVKTALQGALELAKAPKDIVKQAMSTPPKGFLLYGPPGCSKTMVAQALATEGDLNFFAVKGAELINMYVGESERRLRELFQRAREAAPSVIFFDEIDSISSSRSGFGSSARSGGGSSGLNVVTTLLNEMQGFEVLQDVLILAATNRPQAMDPALLRPGRFDRLIYVGPPDQTARLAIFRKWLSTKRGENIDVEELARDTEGFSGAETVGICEAAGWAAWERWRTSSKDERAVILTMEDFREQIKNRPRMITPEMVEAYELWRNKFIKEAQLA